MNTGRGQWGWLDVCLEQGSADVFCKGLDTKYVKFYGPHSLCPSYSILSLYCEKSHRQYVNDGWSNKTLFIHT